MIFVLTIATNTYLNYISTQEAVVEEAVVVTNNSNELIELLPDLIEISTNTFYSKYDVSNASANLQQIASSLLQYQNNLVNRNDISNLNTVETNLDKVAFHSRPFKNCSTALMTKSSLKFLSRVRAGALAGFSCTDIH